MTTCLFDGCDRQCGEPGSGRGYCPKHYLRLRRHGDPAVSKINRDQTGRPCAFEGCERPSGQKGYCTTHGGRLRRHGDPAVASVTGRYRCGVDWIERNAGYTGDDCLRWPFAVSDLGRGTVVWSGKTIPASRAMCLAAHGEPPTPEHHAAHACGKGHDRCCNPRHLRWATPQENEADKLAHGTLRRGSDINTSKLTADDVRAIRASGENGKVLADRYGVSTTAISMVRRRRSWAWLT